MEKIVAEYLVEVVNTHYGEDLAQLRQYSGRGMNANYTWGFSAEMSPAELAAMMVEERFRGSVYLEPARENVLVNLLRDFHLNTDQMGRGTVFY